MSGPNFNDICGFFDCADKVYRARDGAIVSVTRTRGGWRIEECSLLSDESDGSGVWVTDEDHTFPTAKAAVHYLRSIGAERVRSVFDY